MVSLDHSSKFSTGKTREDLNTVRNTTSVRLNTIDDPVFSHDDLSEMFGVEFGYYSTRARECLQSLGRLVQPLRYKTATAGRVAFNVLANLAQVIDRLLGPPQLNHSRTRRLASSWLIV